MIELHVLRDNDLVLVKPLTERLSIGNGSDCDICLPGSPHPLHAVLETHGATVTLKESSGKVYFNGQPVNGSVTLGATDAFDLGEFRVLLEHRVQTQITRTATRNTAGTQVKEDIPFITFKKPKRRTFCQLQITIGRSGDCDLKIPDESFTQKNVSRKHLNIFVKNGVYYAKDLQSKNGTKIHDCRLDDRPLPRRGVLWLGRYELPYEIEDTIAPIVNKGGIVIPSLNPNLASQCIVGDSPAMKKALDKLSRVACGDHTVLILGENGTGKDLFARYLHFYNEKRKRGPFVAVNCAAVPRQLAESYLFGHVKGAFTGAVQNSDGAFVKADGGTLFLDEIGELSTELQAQLLRVLEDQLVEPVGSRKHIPVNVRFVFATNRNIEEERKRKQFRDDLYYRCKNVIQVPALRERKEDIMPLVNHFLSTSGRPLQMSMNTIEFLLRYSWPGNVRELSSAVERGIVNATARNSTVILKEDLELEDGAGAKMPERVFPKSKHLKDAIIRLLAETSGNMSKVAKTLKIGRKTLYRKIETLDIDPTRFRE